MIQVQMAPYPVVVHAAFGKQDADRLAEKHGVSNTESAAGWTTHNDTGTILLAVLDGRLSTLVHECIHAALFCLEHVGIRPTDSRGEVLTYLTESLFHQLASAKGAPKTL